MSEPKKIPRFAAGFPRAS